MRQLLALSMITLFLSPPSVGQGTAVYLPVQTNTTWSLAGSPYTVTSTISIVNGATLTIDPGVVVQFNNSLGITVGDVSQQWSGTIVARGTPSQPILFSSVTPPIPPANNGTWNSLYFTDYAVDAVFDSAGNYSSGCILENCVIERGGLTAAAVRIERSSPFLRACTIQDNSPGGGLNAFLSAGPNGPTPQVLLDECVIRRNRALHGGGIRVGSGGTILISGCVVEGNTLTSTSTGLGGGISLNQVTNSIVENTLIAQNAAAEGGGTQAYGSPNLRITDNVIVGNSAFNGAGVSVFSSTSGIPPTFLRNRISGNVASQLGGGLKLTQGATIHGNNFADNRANDGGALYIGATGVSLSGNSQTAEFNTFLGNLAQSRGDSIYYNIPSVVGTSLDASHVCWGGLDPWNPANFNLIWDGFDNQALAQVWPLNPVPCGPFADLGGSVANAVNLDGLSSAPPAAA